MSTEASPLKVPMNYLGFECPMTGEPCPTRTEIGRLCDPDYYDGMSPEDFAMAAEDSNKQRLLLRGHNAVINQYGCMAEPGATQCPPSVESNNQPAIRGAKRVIKWLLGGAEA